MSLDEQVPEWRALQSASRRARENAWAPYSKYFVGAALLTESGEIVTGCNVENASYGLTICAERVAVSSAVAMGQRRIRAICISLTGIAVPCGACRQFLVEFNPNLMILLDNIESGLESAPELVLLSDLLPRAFRLEHGSL
jgi:cytidine deaminase